MAPENLWITVNTCPTDIIRNLSLTMVLSSLSVIPPLDGEIVGENVYLNIINRARKYVYICTPYLIIDNEMMTALMSGCQKRY